MTEKFDWDAYDDDITEPETDKVEGEVKADSTFDWDAYDDDVTEPETSVAEGALASVIGAGQGYSYGLGDEIGSAIASPIAMATSRLDEDSPEAVEQKLIDQGFKGDIEGYNHSINFIDINLYMVGDHSKIQKHYIYTE